MAVMQIEYYSSLGDGVGSQCHSIQMRRAWTKPDGDIPVLSASWYER